MGWRWIKAWVGGGSRHRLEWIKAWVGGGSRHGLEVDQGMGWRWIKAWVRVGWSGSVYMNT